jgi:hypothetical protein
MKARYGFQLLKEQQSMNYVMAFMHTHLLYIQLESNLDLACIVVTSIIHPQAMLVTMWFIYLLCFPLQHTFPSIIGYTSSEHPQYHVALTLKRLLRFHQRASTFT